MSEERIVPHADPHLPPVAPTDNPAVVKSSSVQQWAATQHLSAEPVAVSA